jgi:hypothetical protein
MSGGAPFKLCSRWIILPGDPEPLVGWLRMKAADEAPEPAEDDDEYERGAA